jgi:hydrogenase maturation factor HypF (carbamoyltransferase family)
MYPREFSTVSPARRMPFAASLIKIQGIVQGVGFRPFVFRLADTLGLTGWVLNRDERVEIHASSAKRNRSRQWLKIYLRLEI